MIAINLSEQEAQVVLVALSELKLKDGFNTFVSVQNQIQKQISKPKVEEKENK